MKATVEKNRIQIRVIQWYGSADPEPSQKHYVQIRNTGEGKKWKTVFVSRLKEINCPPGNKWFLDHYNKRHP